MTSSADLQPPPAARLTGSASIVIPAVVGGLAITVIILAVLLRTALQRETVVETDRAVSNREVTKLAMNRGISLCQAGEVPSGLLWLGRSLQLAPANELDLQRIIRQNIDAWITHACWATDILQHGAVVQALGTATDGKRLVTAGLDGRVCVWNLSRDVNAPGTKESSFGVGDPPTAWAIDSTGKLLITGSDDGTIRFFNTANGKPNRPSISQAGTVSALAISKDQGFIVTGSAAGIIRRFDLPSGKLAAEAPGHGDWVLSIAISQSGKHIVSGANDGTLRLWDSNKMDVSKPAINLVAAVSSVGFSANGSLFVAASGYNATLFKTADQSFDGEPIRHDSLVRSVAFNSTGTMLVTGCRDGQIRTWDVPSRKLALAAIRCVTSVHLVKFTPDDQSILSADDAPAARVWRLPTGDLPSATINAGEPVTALVYSPDGSRVLIGTSTTSDPNLFGGGGGARIYRLDTLVADSPVFADSAGVNSAMFGDDAKTLITGGTDSYVRLWSYPDLKPINTPMHYEDSLRAVAIITGKTQAIAAGGDAGQGDIKFWDYSQPTKDQMPRVVDQDQTVLSVSLSPDRKVIADACADNGARVWDVESVQSTGGSFGHLNAATAIAFEPDGKAVLSGDQNGTARLWSAFDGASLAPAIQAAGPIACIAFSPDGKVAVISTLTPTMKYLGGWGTGTSTVQLWDTKTATAIGPVIRLPTWASWRVAVSPDGQQFAVGSADHFVRFFRMPAPEPRSVSQIVSKIELLLNRRMDENQTELPIFAADWQTRREAQRK